MIIHRPTLRSALSTLVLDRTVEFKLLSGIGAAAHIPDETPNADALRARIAQLGWDLYEDAQADSIYTLLTGGVLRSTVQGEAPRVTASASPSSAGAAAEGVHPRVLAVAQAACITVDELPAWVAQAAINGWEYDDLTGAGDNGDITAAGGRGDRSGLTGWDLVRSSPPPGWPVEGKAPWEIAGWTAPVGFLPPTRPHVVIADTPTPEMPSDRFTSDESDDTQAAAPATPDATLAADDETDELPPAAPPVDEEEIAARLVVLGIAPDATAVQKLLEIARKVPKTEGGEPAPRGKINTKLRAGGFENLDQDAYDLILPLLR
jgi:hypothetical protein